MPALITRYVNCASTAGGDGTTNATAGANRAYASLNEAVDAQQRNLVTADEIAEFICSMGGAGADTINLSFSTTWVCDATRYIIVRAATPADSIPSNLHGGKWNTGVYRLEITGTSGLTSHTLPNTLMHVKFYDIQFRFSIATGGASNTATWFLLSTATAGSRFEMYRCIVKYVNGSYLGSVRFINNNNVNWTIRMANCLFYDWLIDGNSASAVVAYVTSSVGHFNNCTFVSCTRAITGLSSGFHRVRNCIFQITNLLPGSIHVNSNNNASDGAETVTNWGSNSRSSQTFTYVDEPNDDYHLASSDLGAKGYGMDLSADSSLAVTDDIDSEARVAPFDIGCDQYVAPSGGVSRTDITIRILA